MFLNVTKALSLLILCSFSRTKCGLLDLWEILGCGDLLLIDFLKDVFEATIVFLEDGVFGAEVERPGFGQRHLEGAVSKVADGLVRVVHAQSYAAGACGQPNKRESQHCFAALKLYTPCHFTASAMLRG